MDQENRRAPTNQDLSFGANKYLQMAMFMCLFTKEEMIEEVYGRRFTDCIIEDQRRYIAQLERPAEESRHTSSNEGSNYSSNFCSSVAETMGGNSSNSATEEKILLRNGQYELSVSDCRKLKECALYDRAKKNKLSQRELDQPVSMSTLSSMRTTFGIFSATDFLLNSDPHFHQEPVVPLYDSERAKLEMEDDLNLLRKGYLKEFCDGELFDIYDDIKANTQRKRECSNKSVSLNNSTKAHKHSGVPGGSCPDIITSCTNIVDGYPKTTQSCVIVQSQLNQNTQLGQNSQHSPNSVVNQNYKLIQNGVPLQTTTKQSTPNKNIILTNQNLPPKHPNLTSNLYSRDIGPSSNINFVTPLKRPINGVTRNTIDTTSTINKLPKLVATNPSYPLLNKPSGVRLIPQNNQPKPLTTQMECNPKNGFARPPEKPKNSNSINEETMCTNLVKLIKNHPPIISLLQNSMDNFDEALEILLAPLESITTKLNDEQLNSEEPQVYQPKNTNYNFESILNEVVKHSFREQSAKIEKIVANHSSCEFHAIAQRYQSDIYARLKEFRRKVRNKYAARVCRLKRLNENELLKQRNEVLMEILSALNYELKNSICTSTANIKKNHVVKATNKNKFITESRSKFLKQ